MNPDILRLNPIAVDLLHRILPSINSNIKNDEIRVGTWYNGRERGFCLYTFLLGSKTKNLVITFGENRNSDSMFVDYSFYTGTARFLNPPTTHDTKISEELYKSRRLWRPSDIDGAVEFIEHLLSQVFPKDTKNNAWGDFECRMDGCEDKYRCVRYSMQDLIEKGGPVCNTCDEEMEFVGNVRLDA